MKKIIILFSIFIVACISFATTYQYNFRNDVNFMNHDLDSCNVITADSVVTTTGSIGTAAITTSLAMPATVTKTGTTVVTNLNADYVDGYTTGNSSGQVPLSNGTKNTNLVAHYLHSTLYDYTKFLRCAGDTPLTANWAVGNFDITGIDDITATTGTITTATLPTANITTGNITTGNITSGKITTLTGNMNAGDYNFTNVNKITADSITSTIAGITVGLITGLTATNASITNATITSLAADVSCNDKNLNLVNKATMDTLDANYLGDDIIGNSKDITGLDDVALDSLNARSINPTNLVLGSDTYTGNLLTQTNSKSMTYKLFRSDTAARNVWYDDLGSGIAYYYPDLTQITPDSTVGIRLPYLSTDMTLDMMCEETHIDTASTLGTSNEKVASQKATKTYIDDIDYLITESIDLYTTRDDSGSIFTTTTEPKIKKTEIYEPVVLQFDDTYDSTACFVLSITLPTNLTGSNVIIGLVGLNDQAGNSYYDVEYYQTDITKTWETTPVYNQLLINDLNIMKDTFTITNAMASQTIFFKIWRNSALSSSIKAYLLKFVYAYHIDPD